MLRRSLAYAFVTAMMVAVAMPHARADAVPPPSLVGAWTLNKDLSDKPPDRLGGEGREGGQRGAGGRGGGGGHRRGGGFGGGGFGGGGAGQAKTPEDMVRMRNALRDELQAPEHLTITQAETTVIMTAGDGRTTRLSTNGKKIKDESTNVERKTTWAAGKLVSEITGLSRGKITETYSVDSERKQLHVTLQIENSERKATVNRVYAADEQ
jgi:hypothetical protein